MERKGSLGLLNRKHFFKRFGRNVGINVIVTSFFRLVAAGGFHLETEFLDLALSIDKALFAGVEGVAVATDIDFYLLLG